MTDYIILAQSENIDDQLEDGVVDDKNNRNDDGKNIFCYSGKSGRPPRPMLQLAVPANQLEASHGQVIMMIVILMIDLLMMRLTIN